MKTFFILFTLLLAFKSFASNYELEYKKVFLGPIKETDKETLHIGAVVKMKDAIKYGVYGQRKNDPKYAQTKYSYDLLGTVDVETVGIGITINALVQEFDEMLSLNKMDGLMLDSLCGEYNGGNIGLMIIGGANFFTAFNGDGVMIRSAASNTGFVSINLSEINIQVTCNNQKNPNWKKIVRIQ